MYKQLIRKNLLLLTGIFVGTIGGFLYWKFEGCNGGHCMITSVWYNSVIYGGILGGLIASMFGKEGVKKDSSEK